MSLLPDEIHSRIGADRGAARENFATSTDSSPTKRKKRREFKIHVSRALRLKGLNEFYYRLTIEKKMRVRIELGRI